MNSPSHFISGCLINWCNRNSSILVPSTSFLFGSYNRGFYLKSVKTTDMKLSLLHDDIKDGRDEETSNDTKWNSKTEDIGCDHLFFNFGFPSFSRYYINWLNQEPIIFFVWKTRFRVIVIIMWKKFIDLLTNGSNFT